MNENAKQRALQKMAEIFTQTCNKETDIRALFIARTNLDMSFKSSNLIYNEMTDRINEYCEDTKRLYDGLAAFANSTLKLNPARHWPSGTHIETIVPMPPTLLNPPQDSSKMPNPDTMHGAEVNPLCINYEKDTDDIPF